MPDDSSVRSFSEDAAVADERERERKRREGEGGKSLKYEDWTSLFRCGPIFVCDTLPPPFVSCPHLIIICGRRRILRLRERGRRERRSRKCMTAFLTLFAPSNERDSCLP